MTEPDHTDTPEGVEVPLGNEAVAESTGDGEGADDVDEAPDGAESIEEEFEELVRNDIATLTKERDEYLDSLQRLQADFDNYRKRALRQQTDQLERAAEQLIVQLLPVLDALDLAEAHSGEQDSESGALSQIGTLLRGTLEREGLERINEVGVSFDPTEHDAVAHEDEDPDEARGPHVAEVMRAGYRLKGRVLRPAMVKVKG
jgi:molecular chaperone GrpE